MTAELVRIDFYGDQLEACQRDGKVWVSLRRLSDALGVNYAKQLDKLKNKSWATVSLGDMVAEDGKRRELTLVDLETVPMWLASIDEKRVAETVRPKLVRYQRECAKVLADHFVKRSQTDPVPADATLATLEVLRTLRLNQIEQEKKLTAVETKVDQALKAATAAQQTQDSNYGWFTVLAYAKRTGREITVLEASRIGRELSCQLRETGRQPQRIADPRFGHVNLYPETMLIEHFGDTAEICA